MFSLIKYVVYIAGAEVEQVNSYWFLEINITDNQWSSLITTLVRKAQKRLDLLLKLRRLKSRAGFWSTFIRGEIESTLSGSITNWTKHGWCTAQRRRVLQLVIKTNQNITGSKYRASVISVKWSACTEPKGYIKTTPTQQQSDPPGVCCHNTWLQSSFISLTVRLLTSSSALHFPKGM